MGDGCDRLHLDGVHLLQRVIEDSGGINSLESEILVIEVTNEQALGGESVRLDINVRTGHAPQETRLSDIGVATDEQRSGVGVDRGETAQMLADLVEV